MSTFALSISLLAGGTAGFLTGARPDLLMRFVPRRRAADGANHAASEAARAQAYVEILYPLAAAFFVGFVFANLVPHALSHSRGSVAGFFGGVAAMWVLSKFVFKADPCCEAGHGHHGLNLVSLAAVSICSVNDGLIIGLLHPEWYSGLNLGMILHKITSSFAVAQVMIRSGYRGVTLLPLGIAYTLVSPAAMWAVGIPALHLRENEALAAFGTGMLVYVALSSLLPHAVAILRRRPRMIYAMAAALAFSVLLGFWHQALHRSGESLEALEENPSKPDPAAAPSP